MKRDPFVNVNLRVGVGMRPSVSSLVYREECYGLLGGRLWGRLKIGPLLYQPNGWRGEDRMVV